MADEHDKWLDRDAAERLLRGEPLEAVDAETQGRAKRLADALGALAPEPASSGIELPGEAAALAAFQQVRAEREDAAGQLGRRGREAAVAHSGAAGLVRLGRPVPRGRRARRGRPLRLGIAAVLAAGMIGGVAVAAGTGALPTPFRDDSPNPAATVSAVQTPQLSPLSPSPGASRTYGSESPIPDAGATGPADTGSGKDEAGGTGAASGQPGSSDTERSGRSGAWLSDARAYCRDVLDGKGLEAGRRRVLEDAAGGGQRVKKYCKGLLGREYYNHQGDQGDQGDQNSQGDQQGGTGSDTGTGHGLGNGSGGGSGSGSGNGSGSGANGGDDEGHIRPGGSGRNGGSGLLAPGSPAALAPPRRDLTPSSPSAPAPATPLGPRYSALPLLSAV